VVLNIVYKFCESSRIGKSGTWEIGGTLNGK
jgi:hypothetical protein